MVGAHLKESVEQISREGIKFPKKFVPPFQKICFPRADRTNVQRGIKFPRKYVPQDQVSYEIWSGETNLQEEQISRGNWILQGICSLNQIS